MGRSTSQAEIFQTCDRTTVFPYSIGEYVRRYLWILTDVLLIRPSPSRAYGWRRFWLRRHGARLADSSRTRPSTRVLHPWLLTMGDYSVLSERVRIYNLGPIVIGHHTVLSHDVSLCAGTHDYTKPDLPLLRPPIHVGDGVWICAEAFIGPGVTIGDNTVVGARAVVCADVEPGVVVAGNPAVVIKKRPMERDS